MPLIPHGNTDPADDPGVRQFMRRVARLLSGREDQVFKDNEVGPVLVSPDGSKFRIVVDDAGVLSTMPA